MREKVGKSRNTVFPMICGSGGSKSRLAKAAGAEPAGQRSDEKLHAVVARSTFPSENVQNTPFSDHFWKLRCQKSARRCGAKRISKSKVLKTGGLGPLLEVAMSKKCTPLWREAHFEVKMYKTPHVRATFGGSDVEKVHAVVARSTFRSKHVQSTRDLDHFWRFRCRFASLHYNRRHYTTLHSTTLHYTTLHYLPLHLTSLDYITPHYNTLHYTTLHYTTTTTAQLHSTTLHYTTLPSTTLDYFTLHYTTLRSTTLQLQLHDYTPLHFTTLNYTKLHYITLHYNYNYNYTTTLHYTPLHSTTLNYTTPHYITLHSTTTTTTQLHSTTLHYTPLHSTTRNSTTLHYITLHYTPLHSTPLHYTKLH